MDIMKRMLYVTALIACLSQVTVNAKTKFPRRHITTSGPSRLKWSDFPSDFVFGVSTAAAQIEGSTNKEGRGPSVWDDFAKKFPYKIIDGSNLSTATDSYKRYKENVKAVKDLGVHSYRFSISWSRILPKGTLSGGVNHKGIHHYNKLIDELIKYGITPFVTLLHFDAPQALTDKYGGILNRSFVDDFKDYSELCFKTYGDRVKNWITINEPRIIAEMGYDLGVAAPGRCSNHTDCKYGNSATEPYIVTHNLLISHATVVKLYREKFQSKQGGQIGWSHPVLYFEPYSNSSKDKAAARRLLDFKLGWYIEPLVHGDYPKSMRRLVKERLPRFTKQEKKLVIGAFDFLGINYYTSRYGQDLPPSPFSPIRSVTDPLAIGNTTNVNGVEIGLQAKPSNVIFSYPKGLMKLLKFMKRKYKNPTIYITENGITDTNDKTNGNTFEALHDPHRIECIQNHLYMIRRAMKSGVKVKGYFHWSLFDDFEWGEGFTARYGLYYVDQMDNLKYIPKKSAKWLSKFLKS